MESTVEVDNELLESRSGSVGEKRPAEEDDGVLVPPRKRIRGGGELKKVAEMVLVLAAMGKMRGGKGPTDAEKELMTEARSRLTEVCEGFAPKDVFPRNAFGGLIEDLGLNKLKEHRVGFRPPKVSIAEKLLLSKRKMEKAEDLSLPSAPHSVQRLQGNSGTSAENVAKSTRMTISASPVGHVTTSNVTTPVPFQLPTSEIRPIVTTALPASHMSSAAFPRADRPQIRPDGRSNGSVYPSQVQASRTPTWSVQPQPVQPANITSINKVSVKAEGAVNVRSGLPSQATSRTVNAAASSQGTNYVHPPGANIHAETAKMIQDLLRPRVLERPIWNPPSRDYMSKPLTCQMCMSTVVEIDNVLICDACEKGYHLKCLQMTHQKGVQRGEWHCAKCLSFSNGKPLPPKYGRVMRNSGMPKVSSNPPVPSTTKKRMHASDDKAPQPNITVNGDTVLEKDTTGVAGNNYNHHQIPGFRREDVKEIQENDKDSNRGKMDGVASGTCPSNEIKTSLSGGISSMDSACEKIIDDKAIDMKPNSSAESQLVPNSSDEPQATVGGPHGEQSPLNDEASAQMESLENNVVGNSEDTCADGTLNNAKRLKLQDVPDDSSENATNTGVEEEGGSSSDVLPDVNWVGDPIQALDDKIFYGSCCINGHVYKAMDHVLVCFEDGRLIPSKLQAMWEDTITTMKWVTVIPCYFPGDLPETVGRPCGLEIREVYESTKVRTLMAGLIEGPCQVLPPRNFEEEIEKRTRTGSQNDHLPPVYMCKWIYDEAKELFRDISC